MQKFTFVLCLLLLGSLSVSSQVDLEVNLSTNGNILASDVEIQVKNLAIGYQKNPKI